MTILIKSLLFIFLVQVFLLGKTKNIVIFTNLGSESENNILFELGIRDELIAAFTNEYDYPAYKNKIEFLLPFNLHLSAGIRFLNQYKIDFRFGIMAAADYIFGLEEGFFFKVDLFNTNFYGTTGIYFFNNNLASDGITWTGGKFTFYCFGLGYEASRNWDIDIIYGFPGDNKIYAHEPSFEVDGGVSNKKINGFLRIGFQYSFVF